MIFIHLKRGKWDFCKELFVKLKDCLKEMRIFNTHLLTEIIGCFTEVWNG